MAISEITVAGIKRDLLSGNGAAPAIAKRWKVSLSTVKRIKTELGGAAISTAADVVKLAAMDQTINEVAASGFVVDRTALLTAAIHKLNASVATAQPRSQEGAAGALAKLLELHAKWKPMTIDELIDCALDIPDFDPLEFARRLRKRMERAG